MYYSFFRSIDVGISPLNSYAFALITFSSEIFEMLDDL